MLFMPAVYADNTAAPLQSKILNNEQIEKLKSQQKQYLKRREDLSVGQQIQLNQRLRTQQLQQKQLQNKQQIEERIQRLRRDSFPGVDTRSKERFNVNKFRRAQEQQRLQFKNQRRTWPSRKRNR